MAGPSLDTAQVEQALHGRWASHLRPFERFEVRLGRSGGNVVLDVALVVAGDERHELEVRVGEGPRALDVALDAADALLGEWLVAGRPRLSGVPERRELGGVAVDVTARTRHPGLEAEADRLLGDDLDEA